MMEVLVRFYIRINGALPPQNIHQLLQSIQLRAGNLVVDGDNIPHLESAAQLQIVDSIFRTGEKAHKLKKVPGAVVYNIGAFSLARFHNSVGI